MIMQFILIALLLISLLFALIRREKAPFIALCMVTLSAGSIVLVLFPSIAQGVATWAGIGRGVDLVTYLFMAMMLVVILDVYLRLQAAHETLTQLVRHISLEEASRNEKTTD